MLRRTLPSISEAIGHAPGANLIVVEQGERVADEVCADAGVTADVVHDDGDGAAHARNIGATHAQSDVLLFTDDDCAVPPTWVVEHLAALSSPDLVASFGVVEGLPRASSDAEDPVARRVRHRAGSPPWLIGHSSNMAVDRKMFLSLGGFDERLGPGTRGMFIGEDADLIVRLLGRGVVVSGTGEPVRHLEWRTAEEDAETLRAYERGAGAWIGKLMRSNPRLAMTHLVGRLRLIARQRSLDHRLSAGQRIRALFGDFARGVAYGLRLGEWRGGINSSSG